MNEYRLHFFPVKNLNNRKYSNSSFSFCFFVFCYDFKRLDVSQQNDVRFKYQSIRVKQFMTIRRFSLKHHIYVTEYGCFANRGLKLKLVPNI